MGGGEGKGRKHVRLLSETFSFIILKFNPIISTAESSRRIITGTVLKRGLMVRGEELMRRGVGLKKGGLEIGWLEVKRL